MANKFDEVCAECGHLRESHTIGTGRCKVNFCGCREFAEVSGDEQ